MEDLLTLKEMLERYLEMTNRALDSGGEYEIGHDDGFHLEEVNYETIISDLAYEIKTLY